MDARARYAFPVFCLLGILTAGSPRQVVEGNIFDESSLSSILPGHDSVMSCLGFPRNPQPVT